jgi:1,4-alpha-glucan branching enzyme
MSLKKKYTMDKEFCKVTFVLPTHIADNTKKAFIAGDFNSWDPKSTRMKKMNGKFIRTLKLKTRQKYQFRYVLDETVWTNDWDCDTLARVPFGDWYNSVISV